MGKTEKRIGGRKYNIQTANAIGFGVDEDKNGTILFRKNNGEYFMVEVPRESNDYKIIPFTIFEAIRWGKDYLKDCDFESEFGVSKEGFISLAEGKTEHTRYISKEEDAYVQDDILTTRISLNVLGYEDVHLLAHWGVDEFDRAYIDWNSQEIVLDYVAEHYISEDYAFEMLRDPDTIDLTEED